MAVGSVVMLALYGVLISVLRAGSGAGAFLDRDLEAGLLLDSLASDVNSAYFNGQELKTIFTGKTRAGASALELTSFAAQPQREGTPSADLVGVSYFAKHADGGLIVYRETWNPYIGQRYRSEILTGVEAFEMSYYNGGVWANAWDASLEKKLPTAVKARVVFKGGREFTALARTMIR